MLWTERYAVNATGCTINVITAYQLLLDFIQHFIFHTKTKKRKEVVTDVKIEFTHTSGGKGYCFEADIYKTKQIEQEEQRSQYLSDYNFD